ARDEVEIAWIGYGRVVVAERCGKDFRAAIIVRPDDNIVGVCLFAGLALGRLLAAGQWRRGAQQLSGAIVIQLLVDRAPILTSLRNRARPRKKLDSDRRLRPVTSRLQSGELEPRRDLR